MKRKYNFYDDDSDSSSSSQHQPKEEEGGKSEDDNDLVSPVNDQVNIKSKSNMNEYLRGAEQENVEIYEED